MISLNQYKKPMIPKDNSWAHSNNIAHGSPQNSFGQSQRVPEHSRMQYKSNYSTLTTKYNQKAPLEDSVRTQINFKGAFDRSLGKMLTPAIETVSREGLECLIKIVEKNSSAQKAQQYKDYVKNYLVQLLTDEAFHPHIRKEMQKGLGESFATIAQSVGKSSNKLNKIADVASKNKNILYAIKININALKGKPEYNHLKEYAEAAAKHDSKKLKTFIKNLLSDKYYYSDLQNTLFQKNKAFNTLKLVYALEDQKIENILKEQVIDKGQVYYSPIKNLVVRTANGFVDPILDKINSNFIKLVKKTNPKPGSYFANIINRHETFGKYSGINGKFLNVPGTLKAIEIEKAKTPYMTDEEIGRLIAKNDAKAFDFSKHSTYSASSISTGNRITSGIITAAYLGTDSYNTVMKLKNDKKMAESERKSRLAQEGARVGLAAYLQITAMTIFKQVTDRHMGAALAVSAAVVAISETIGRAMIGKPILPKSKEQLDAMDAKMKNNTGLRRKIGGLLSRDTAPKATKPNNTQPAQSQQKSNVSFSGGSNFVRNIARAATRQYENIFVTGNQYAMTEVKELLHLIKMADADKAAKIESNIINGMKKLDKCHESVKSINELSHLEHIFIGKSDSKARVILESFLKPAVLAKKWSFDLVNLAENGLTKLHIINEPSYSSKLARTIEKIEDKQSIAHFEKRQSKIIEKLAKELQTRLEKAIQVNDKASIEKFEQKLADLKDAENAGYKAYDALSDEQKFDVAKKYLEMEEYQNTKLEGIKNLFDIIKARKEEVAESGENLVDKIKSDLETNVNKTLSNTAGASYDASKFAIFNINLARAVTGFFLINDAYNLTMQLSNGNKQDSVDSGKKRFFQEVSRSAFSSYLIGITHSIFTKFHNSTLAGALTITAGNVLFNEAISRKTVGMAVLPSTKAELEKLEQDNLKSKNPVVKFIGGIIGKKRSNPAQPAQKPAAQVALAGKSGLDQTRAAMMYISHANTNAASQPVNTMNTKAFEMLKAKKAAV